MTAGETRIHPARIATLNARHAAFLLVGLLIMPPPALAGRTARIDTREGTWMSVDIAPDGGRLVFDLLGDLYEIPVAGGEARRLTPLPKPVPGLGADRPGPPGGQAFDSQPRFSPDGSEIAFVSDRDGADNLYCMKADGSGLRRLTSGRNVVSSPDWSLDGRFVAARRTPAGADSGGGGTLWVYRADGSGGYPVDLPKPGSITGPAFAPDGGLFYATKPSAAHQVWRFDRATGKATQVTQEFGGAIRPRASRDGKSLAYATFDDGEAVLRLRNLASGEDRALLRGVEQGLFVAGSGRLDVFPGFCFGPDGGSIFLAFGGKIHRLQLDGTHREVPFHVATELAIGPQVPRTASPVDGAMPVRMLHWAGFAPDGRLATFDAIGKVWAVDGRGGTPRRLTSVADREYAPALSPDGQWVAYVRWSDRRRGAVMKVPTAGGDPVELTREPGYYANPTWSPDGSRIVVAVGGGADVQGHASIHDLSRTFAWLPAEGGPLRPITTIAFAQSDSNVHLQTVRDTGARFNRDGTRIWYTQAGELRSVRLDGADERVHLKLVTRGMFEDFDVPCDFIVSPDEENVAFMAGNNEIWVLPMPWSTAKPVEVDLRAASLPGLRKVTTLAGYFPAWVSKDELSWTFAGKLHRRRLDSDRTLTVPVELEATPPRPLGTLALVGARVITSRGDEVIPSGTVVVGGNRIVAVGPSGRAAVPEGAETVDVTGKTIIAGVIDVHDHILMGSTIRNWPEQDPYLATALSYGVTTIRDVSAANLGSFYLAELANAGQMLAPRAFESGQHLLPPLVQIRDAEDAARVVAIQQQLGAVVLKEYQQPARRDWQFLLDAARQAGIMTTAEGSIDLKSNLTRVIDGFSQTEHMWAYHPLHGDVVQLAAAADVSYTPTLGTSAAASERWYRAMAVDRDPKQGRWLAHSDREHLWRRILGQKTAPEWSTVYETSARNAKKMLDGGVTVGVGSHDEPTPTGLGTHWEMWSYVEGGMSPIEAIRCGTIGSAKTIGMLKDLGSIEAGKLADLVVLNANPLDDIKNSIAIDSIVADGRLLRGDTLRRVDAPGRPAGLSDPSR